MCDVRYQLCDVRCEVCVTAMSIEVKGSKGVLSVLAPSKLENLVRSTFWREVSFKHPGVYAQSCWSVLAVLLECCCCCCCCSCCCCLITCYCYCMGLDACYGRGGRGAFFSCWYLGLLT